jgi:carboxymethylenebutenolidase
MGTTNQITAADGHTLDAYVAEPAGPPRAGLVVIQEIFGVNSHIKEVTDGFAREGFKAIAPALFDRLERRVELGYEAADLQRGREIAMRLTPEQILSDVSAAIDALKLERVGIVGYCLGGTVAFRASATLPVKAAVAYYGGSIAKLLDLEPRCPVMAHFGEKDIYIPMSEVEAIRQRYPSMPVHVYDADHGFSCDHRSSYDEKSSKLARERTLAFFHQHLG